MEPEVLGEIDGKQIWWCRKCQATAFAAKRNLAPDVQHATDCGKAVIEAATPSMPSEK